MQHSIYAAFETNDHIQSQKHDDNMWSTRNKSLPEAILNLRFHDGYIHFITKRNKINVKVINIT